MNGNSFAKFLDPFEDVVVLRDRVRVVLQRLPKPVVDDLLHDASFHISLENYIPGEGWSLWMAMPDANGSGSRAVVLRRRLNDCREDFALYVIAHEFAHAHLHNRGWGEYTDPEQAADALAESWGFPKVSWA